MYKHIKKIIITSSTLKFKDEEIANKFKVGTILTIDGDSSFFDLIHETEGVFIDTLDGSVKAHGIWIFHEDDPHKPDSMGIVCFKEVIDEQ